MKESLDGELIRIPPWGKPPQRNDDVTIFL